MQILKLKGFLFEPNDPAIYDRDSKTVLELCGRLGYKINELIDEYNRFYEEMLENYQEAYDYMVTNLGLFVTEQLPILAPGIMEELWGEDIDGLLQDMADLKAEYKYYNGINDLKETGDQAPVGAYLKTTYYANPGDMGGALYQVVDHLEEGEEANNEDIIALGVTLDPTKWAKMVPGDIVHSTSFLSLQHAIDYAYKNWLDVLVCELYQIEGNINIPFNEDTPVRRVRLIGANNLTTGIQINGLIKLNDEATFVNYSLENMYLESTSSGHTILGALNLDTLAGTTIDFIKDCYITGTKVTIYHGNGLTIKDNTMVDSCLFFSESTDCKVIHNTFTHDEYNTIGNLVKTDSCFNLLFENNTYTEYGDDICCDFEQTSNSHFKNETYNMIGVVQELMVIGDCSFNSFDNIYIGGTSTYNRLIYLDNSNGNTFNSIKPYYTNSNLTGNVFNLISSDNNYFEDIVLNDKTGFLISNTSAHNVIKDYVIPLNSPLVTIVSSVNSSDNTIELLVDTDVERLTASGGDPLIHFTIPSEIKYGNTTTMNLLYDYNGRIFYNTETRKTLICNNHVWEEVGDVTQYSTMPNPSSNNEGVVVQFVGTTGSYTKGHFYECVYDSGNDTYSWEEISFGGGGGSALEYYDFNAIDNNTYILFNQYGSFNVVGDDQQQLIDILNDAHDKGYKTFLIKCYFKGINVLPTLICCSIADLDFTGSWGFAKFSLVYDSLNYSTSLCYGYNNNGTNITFYNVSFAITDGVITGFYYLGAQGMTGTYLCLPVNNTESYTPTGDYNPATKLYVDGEDLTAYVEAVDPIETTLARFKLRKVGKQFFMQGFITATNGGTWNDFNIKMPSSYLYETLPSSNSSTPVGVSSLINFGGTPVSLPVYSYLSYDASDNQVVTLKFSPYDNLSHTPGASDSIAVNLTWTYEQ